MGNAENADLRACKKCGEGKFFSDYYFGDEAHHILPEVIYGT